MANYIFMAKNAINLGLQSAVTAWEPGPGGTVVRKHIEPSKRAIFRAVKGQTGAVFLCTDEVAQAQGFKDADELAGILKKHDHFRHGQIWLVKDNASPTEISNMTQVVEGYEKPEVQAGLRGVIPKGKDAK